MPTAAKRAHPIAAKRTGGSQAAGPNVLIITLSCQNHLEKMRGSTCPSQFYRGIFSEGWADTQ